MLGLGLGTCTLLLHKANSHFRIPPTPAIPIPTTTSTHHRDTRIRKSNQLSTRTRFLILPSMGDTRILIRILGNRTRVKARSRVRNPVFASSDPHTIPIPVNIYLQWSIPSLLASHRHLLLPRLKRNIHFLEITSLGRHPTPDLLPRADPSPRPVQLPIVALQNAFDFPPPRLLAERRCEIGQPMGMP